MDPFILGLEIFGTLSFSANLSFLYLLEKIKKQYKSRSPDANAQEVLSQLMAGPVVIRIELIEKGSLVQWRNS